MPSKKTLLAGAAVAAVSIGVIGGTGMASAATPSSTADNSNTSIVDKIATKFNLNKDEVKAVFDEERAAKHAEHKAERAEQLTTAVKDGKLTQAQADYITKAQAEIEALMETATPGTETDTVREQIKAKMEALHTWAKDNNVDFSYLGGGHHGHGGHDGSRGERHFTKTIDSN